jgi:hypothetical protein
VRISANPGIQGNGFTFGIAPKVTKSLGPKPPKAEKPDSIPKIPKLATLKQYGFLNGIPPGFSPAERFFRQRPGGYRGSDIIKKTCRQLSLQVLLVSPSTQLINP